MAASAFYQHLVLHAAARDEIPVIDDARPRPVRRRTPFAGGPRLVRLAAQIDRRHGVRHAGANQRHFVEMRIPVTP